MAAASISWTTPAPYWRNSLRRRSPGLTAYDERRAHLVVVVAILAVDHGVAEVGPTLAQTGLHVPEVVIWRSEGRSRCQNVR